MTHDLTCHVAFSQITPSAWSSHLRHNSVSMSFLCEAFLDPKVCLVKPLGQGKLACCSSGVAKSQI